MKKDIKIPTFKDVWIAVVQEKKLQSLVWNAYVINAKKEPIQGVLVNSKGYGSVNGEPLKTSVLRHFLDVIKPCSYKKIEQLPKPLLSINNEFWLSFYLKNKMYDKKFIFLAESITQLNLVDVPIINKKGILIK